MRTSLRLVVLGAALGLTACGDDAKPTTPPAGGYTTAPAGGYTKQPGVPASTPATPSPAAPSGIVGKWRADVVALKAVALAQAREQLEAEIAAAATEEEKAALR